MIGALGCETGRPSSGDGGLGLAQAFLLRGARVVVVSDRPVGDETAAAVAAILYTERGAGAVTAFSGARTEGNADLDLPARLHRAQVELSARFDDVWTLRAFVR